MIADPGTTVSGNARPPTGDGSRASNHDARSITRTALALLSAQSIAWVSSVLGIVVLPRFLGPQDFGVFATALTIGAVVSTLGAFGTGPHMVKGSARDPSRAASLFVQAVALRGVTWAALTLPLLPLSAVFIENPATRSVVLLVAAAGLFGLVSDAAIGSMQANHAVGRPAVLRSVVVALSQFASGALLVLGQGVVMVAVVHVASAVVVAVGTTFMFWSRFGGTVSVTFADMRGLARAGRHYLSWDLALLVYGRADQLMLAAMVGTAAVGLYAFAYRLLAIPALIPAIVSSATYPALAATAHRNEVQFRNILAGALRVVLLTGMPAATGLFLLAGDLTTLLAGPEFRAATIVVMLLALHMPLVAVDGILGSAVVARDRQAVWARVGWLAALFNPLTNLIAIPLAASYWSNGAIGAAVATLLTESVMTCSAIYLMRRHLGVETLMVAARVVLACAAMSAVVLVTRTAVGWWASIPAGCVTYVLLVIALRLVRPSDLSLARAAVRAKTQRADLPVPA